MHLGDLRDDVSVISQGGQDEDSSTYLSTEYSHIASTQSKRSLYPPPSWPTSADLAKDSNVYPVENTTPMQSRRLSASLDSHVQELSLKGLDNTAKISISPSPDVSLDLSTRTAKSTGKSVSGPEMCSDVCGSACTCSIDADLCEERTVSRLSTPSLPPITSPEFDLPNISTFINLPIKSKMLTRLCFGETMIISRDIKYPKEEELRGPGSNYPEIFDPNSTEEIGGMCISIQESNQNIVISCTSQFSFENSGAASSILSVVDRKFKLIEEKKTETLHRDGWKQEKSLHVFSANDRLTAFRTSVDAHGTKRHRGVIKMNAEGNLVLDGGGFALMRYLVLEKFKGDLEVWSMHISGEVCRVAYNVGKPKLFMINGQPRETIRIVKLLLRNHRKVEVSKSYYLPTGHLVRHRWIDCEYFIHINPLAKIPPCPYMVCLEKAWENDIMLFSKYLDLKQEKKAHMNSYLEDNPQFKCMIKDYLLCLLQRKPKYVLDFSIDYFRNLLNAD